MKLGAIAMTHTRVAVSTSVRAAAQQAAIAAQPRGQWLTRKGVVVESPASILARNALPRNPFGSPAYSDAAVCVTGGAVSASRLPGSTSVARFAPLPPAMADQQQWDGANNENEARQSVA